MCIWIFKSIINNNKFISIFNTEWTNLHTFLEQDLNEGLQLLQWSEVDAWWLPQMECASLHTPHMEMCRQTCLVYLVQRMEILQSLAATAMVLCRHLYSLRQIQMGHYTAEAIPHSVFSLCVVCRHFHSIADRDYGLLGFDTMLTGNLLLIFQGCFLPLSQISNKHTTMAQKAIIFTLT